MIAFVDADLREFTPHFVSGLVGPLLTDPSVDFVKGFYHRPLVGTGGVEPDGGGRVTELIARPLLNLFWPELAGFVQPLAGEYAARRDVLERLPFVSGYGVEIGDADRPARRWSVSTRWPRWTSASGKHRHQDTAALGRMSAQILLHRLVPAAPPGAGPSLGAAPGMLTQFRRGDGVGPAQPGPRDHASPTCPFRNARRWPCAPCPGGCAARTARRGPAR